MCFVFHMQRDQIKRVKQHCWRKFQFDITPLVPLMRDPDPSRVLTIEEWVQRIQTQSETHVLLIIPFLQMMTKYKTLQQHLRVESLEGKEKVLHSMRASIEDKFALKETTAANLALRDILEQSTGKKVDLMRIKTITPLDDEEVDQFNTKYKNSEIICLHPDSYRELLKIKGLSDIDRVTVREALAVVEKALLYKSMIEIKQELVDNRDLHRFNFFIKQMNEDPQHKELYASMSRLVLQQHNIRTDDLDFAFEIINANTDKLAVLCDEFYQQ